ncbi:MAG TPA: ATPase, T2SS/T4P/T4SS family [Candidatus Tumulicola sp.]|nr:ATPase, T2SS/T4P/T4SS family [Candidatus Tumulicola sp.]
MSAARAQSSQPARTMRGSKELFPDLPKAERRFKRRRMRLSVTIRTNDGRVAMGETTDLSAGGMRFESHNELKMGDVGSAQIRLTGSDMVRVPVEIVWHNAIDPQEHEYGISFGDMVAADRFMLFETIYSPANGTKGFADSNIDPDDDVPRIGAEPITPAHYQYYLRLLRRIDQVHKLDASAIDKIFYARLLQGRNLRDVLTEFSITPRESVDQFLSDLYHVPFIDLTRIRPDEGEADVIPEHMATDRLIVPVRREEEKFIVAMADPSDLLAIDMLNHRVKMTLDVRFALIEDVANAINNLYHAASLHSVDRLLDSVPETSGALDAFAGMGEVEDLETLRKLSDTQPIVQLVESLLRTSVEDRASDIHLEPFADKVSVRFRLDGVLRELRTLPKRLYPAVVSRIKIMSRMDITIRHVPQDGGMSMRYQRKDFDLRISSMPTVYGEKIVIRLLEKNPIFKSLKSTGFSERNYDAIAPLTRRPYGMLLCCGPTGSGKSTTLFAVLQEINDGTTNITTIEEPVEYRVAGVNQVEIQLKRNLTFASVLRAILRQDPDVIYVGEIRDRETADLAVRAALTGHLLLSTLHTNTAIQAIARLVDIGVDPAMIASSLLGVVGQRLMRRICDRCVEDYEVPLEEQVVLQEMVPVATPKVLRRGRGCERCHESGYHGRLAVHEVVVVDEGLRRLIARGADSGQLLDYVTSRGFTDLRDDAIGRMLSGETTLREVLRVTA